MMDACTYLMATLYFWKVCKDWFYFAAIGWGLNFISAVGSWFLPESPRYLLEKGKIQELEQTMQVIAKVNGKELRFNPENFKKRPIEPTSPIADSEDQSN